MLVSTVQRSESATHVPISPLFWVSFPFRLWRYPEWCPCYTLGSHYLSISIYNSVYVSPNLPVHPTSQPPWCPHIYSLPLCLFLLCKCTSGCHAEWPECPAVGKGSPLVPHLPSFSLQCPWLQHKGVILTSWTELWRDRPQRSFLDLPQGDR